MNLNPLPAALIWFRLAAGPLAMLGARWHWPAAALVALLIAGLLSDIFDGIIARRLGVATPRLRHQADIVFWACICVAAAWVNPGLIARHWQMLGAVALLEIGVNAISVLRFGRPAATHTWLAKAWGLALSVLFAMLLAHIESPGCIRAVLGLGIAVYVEVAAILLIWKTPPVDVAWVFLGSRKRADASPKRYDAAGQWDADDT